MDCQAAASLKNRGRPVPLQPNSISLPPGPPPAPLSWRWPMDLGGHKILVLRTEDGVAAFSRRCTDLGCLVSWNKERAQFICPCHQGTFDRTGLNIAGPPPRPLDRLQIVKRGEQLYVNIQATS